MFSGGGGDCVRTVKCYLIPYVILLLISVIIMYLMLSNFQFIIHYKKQYDSKGAFWYEPETEKDTRNL